MSTYPPPSPIYTTPDNWFAHDTMAVRLPKNIRLASTYYTDTPAIAQALRVLAQAIESDRPLREALDPNIPFALSPLAWDYDEWMAELEPFKEDSWHATSWFFAETFAFRLSLEASRFFANRRDPFGPLKQKELETDGPAGPVLRFLQESQSLGKKESPRDRTLRALHLCIWGNKADLSFTAGGTLDHQAGDSKNLLINDDEKVADLLTHPTGPIHIIMDNSGAELAGDLILADELANQGTPVILRPKLYPTYVSDTLPEDITNFLAYFALHKNEDLQLWAGEITSHLKSGRIQVIPDDFWCQTKFLSQAPPRILQTFTGAGCIIIKGDFNYRRGMRDTQWDASVPVRQAMGISKELPPFLYLRTMKSDCLAGLAQEIRDGLDQTIPGWRIQGKKGLIQLA